MNTNMDGLLPDLPRQIADAVNPDRVMARIEALATIGGLPNGGVDRPAFSDTEQDATELFARWMREAGLTVVYDAFGNLFGSTDANAPGSVVSAAGSHLDTVPSGGRYDGVIGCIGALEVIAAMHDAGVTPPMPMEVIVWRSEEPYRFMQGRVGSLMYAGKLTVADLVPRGEPFDVAAWLQTEEARPRRGPGRTLASLLELHIEQGRRLEDAGVDIGVVTAISGTTRLRITLTGTADHSGATPMGLRHDALAAAAEVVLATERAGRDEPLPESVATAAILTVTPGAMNVVPGGAEVFLDIRSTDAASVARMITAITDATTAIAQRRRVTVEISMLTQATPVALEPAMIAAVETGARTLGYSTMQMASGAGHDAQSVAERTHAGMIFVPSRDGISHAPQEYTAPDAILRGMRTLASTWTRISASTNSNG